MVRIVVYTSLDSSFHVSSLRWMCTSRLLQTANGQGGMADARMYSTDSQLFSALSYLPDRFKELFGTRLSVTVE